MANRGETLPVPAGGLMLLTLETRCTGATAVAIEGGLCLQRSRQVRDSIRPM